eukprot:TRINITY_DN18531_c4_g1_i1.p1 TRINITY_DN18531_c4_g1~~TRINITY_DN18531_c4_g1_i1.p1  ORF type:complete len:295 (-),score=66.55 TRINITY_DN18531_c4_g1_i1:10-894(-)
MAADLDAQNASAQGACASGGSSSSSSGGGRRSGSGSADASARDGYGHGYGYGSSRAGAPGSAGGSALEDLKEVIFGQSPVTSLLPAFVLAAVLVAFLFLPAFRVENGSRDSCDPVRTYGEISAAGREALIRLARAPGETSIGAFVDLGSGEGHFPIWACTHGGFWRCLGVELQKERHERAEAALAAAGAAAGAAGVSLLLGNVLDFPHLFDDASLVYWNNLCFPPSDLEAVAARFARLAPDRAVLVSLVELPETSGLVRSELDEPLAMAWSEEPYRAYRHVKEGSARTKANQEL